MSTPAHVTALDKAKISLMSKEDTVFFCELAFSLKYKWSTDVPTAATDGVHLYMNPEFFMKWNREQQLGLILHETLHVAYLHMARVGQRDRKLYNMAADYVINLVITQRGFKLPDGGLLDRRFIGMSTEEVYDLLLEEQKQQEQSPGSSSSNNGAPMGGMGEDLLDPPPGMTEEERDAHIEQTLIRASLRSKESDDKIGTIPGDIELLLQKLLKPKLPWNRILQKYLQNFAKNNYTFKRPNRRFFPEHHLPSLYSENLIELAVAVDISGSVSDEEFTQFVSEVATIFKMLSPPKIKLIQFDTEIKSVNEIKNIRELVQVKFTGRGGTEIGELIDWTNSNKPQLLLVFTDGEFAFKDYETKQNILWIIHNNPEFQPEFGKAIYYGI